MIGLSIWPIRLHLRRGAVQAVLWQGLAVALVLAAALLLLNNVLHNMHARGIRSGFDFLLQPTGFAIGEGLLHFDSADALWRAFVVGLFNTLRVAVIGIVLATVLGVALGIGQLARHVLWRGLCRAYVELLRSTPLLLQLLMLYLLLAQRLPALDSPWHLGALTLDKGGLTITLQGLVPLVPLLTLVRAPLDITPLVLTPEYIALQLGLTLYTAAFIAEVVRSGIRSVAAGQVDAARALGLSPWQQLRFVVLPQALRVSVPPLANQYLALTKNSSLAVAIGYPDLLSIANTALNQSGRAVECLAIVMAVYLSTSLLTSAVMNVYNSRVALRGVHRRA